MRTRSAHRLRAGAVVVDGNNVDLDRLPSSQDGRSEAGRVMFTYDHGPGGPIAVNRSDWMSLADDTDMRDGLVDAVARYFWQEELSPKDSADCLVFCSVWYTLLREGGPTRVTAMTQAVDVFSFSTWVFFFCEGGHWSIAVVSGVQRLERALGVTANGGATHTSKPAAALAFFNSMRGLPPYSRVRSAIVDWLHFECMRRGLVGDNVGRLRPGWVASCLAISTPTVPQQRNAHDCGLYALSFFRSFFQCRSEDRSLLMRSGVVGRSAWQSVFQLQTRVGLRNVCAALMERERGACDEVVHGQHKASGLPYAMGAGALAQPVSAPRDGIAPSRRSGLRPRPISATNPKPGIGVADFGALAVAPSGGQLTKGLSKPWHVPDGPSVAAAALPQSTTTKSEVEGDGACGIDHLLEDVAKDQSHGASEPASPTLPLELKKPSVEADAYAPSTSDTRNASSSSKVRKPARGRPSGNVPRQRSPDRKRARLDEADLLVATWTSEFHRWGLPMEPVAAATLCSVFSKTDGLTPAFVNLFASGVAKWHPPASQRRLAPWFAAAVLDASSKCGMGGGAGASLMLLSQVHTVLRSAYHFHGHPMPDDRSI